MPSAAWLLRPAFLALPWLLNPASADRCGSSFEQEVADLRANPLEFVVKLGQPYLARQVLLDRKLRARQPNVTCAAGDGWPWRLKVDIAVNKGPYKQEHRVIFEVPPAYPKQLPLIRFGNRLTHGYLTTDEEAHSSLPTQHLFAALRRDGATLVGVLKVLHTMLQKPLDGSDSIWKTSMRAHREQSAVARKYRRRRTHKNLFTLRGFDAENYLEDSLRLAIANISDTNDPDAARLALLNSGVVTEIVPGSVYSFPAFKQPFCELLMEEIRGFSRTGLPAKRPNSMNNYGIILNDIGLNSLVFALQDTVIQPFAAVLFPKEGSELESHHAFTVRYKRGEDTHLDVHTDDSDVTFNVNLFGDYAGCPLIVCGRMGARDHRQFRTAYQHRLGVAVMHTGQQRHGAGDITEGERHNLIVWSYSYNYRQAPASKRKHKRENAPPDPRCLSYTHDRDYGRFKEYPPGKRERFFGRGWCPQQGKEYKGFVPEAPQRSAAMYRDDL